MENYENPNHDGNSTKHHTGKPCIEPGCDKPAGTAWSPYWCMEHNAERMTRIDASLEQIAARFREREMK